MDFSLHSLRIAGITDLSYYGKVEETLLQLVYLEEDRVVLGFHQQVWKEREKDLHD
jgi:hypothetical protein